MADEHQLQQVLLNVIVNAEQAMLSQRNNGLLTVKTGMHVRERVRYITVSITDDGPGIEARHLARIFDPFFTTKPVNTGTGLGLSISYGIVKEHGGEITVESRPGKGATFTVEIPGLIESEPGL
jgi:two-component system NtrC family sensor kinase